MAATNPKPISILRRRVLPLSLAAVAAVLAAVLARTAMPSAPAGYATGQPAGQASRTPAAATDARPSPSDTQQPPPHQPTPEPSADTATMCYVNMAGVRYRAAPNAMAISYGLAHKGQAFTVEKYVHDSGGSRWAFGDLQGARRNVYLAANLLNC